MKKITVILLVLPLTVFGQIVIDNTEIPHQIGIHYRENTNDSIPIDIGPSGGPHVWDFTSQPMGEDSVLYTIVDKNTTPYADSFPAANVVWLIAPFDTAADTMIFYERLTTDSLNGLGVAGVKVDAQLLVLKFNPISHTPLPIAYQDEWVDHYGYGFVYSGYNVRVDNYSHYKIDAYGSVQIPYGTFECLRMRSYDTVITQVPHVFYDTATYINYCFITENYGDVAYVSSHEGETNPNFTEGSLSRITGFWGVEENSEIPKTIVEHFPNPFCDAVNIKYSISVPGEVSLKVYNVSGEIVGVLVNELKEPGVYRAVWNGRDERGNKLPAGIYFYKLQTAKQRSTKKLIMLK